MWTFAHKLWSCCSNFNYDVVNQNRMRLWFKKSKVPFYLWRTALMHLEGYTATCGGRGAVDPILLETCCLDITNKPNPISIIHSSNIKNLKMEIVPHTNIAKIGTVPGSTPTVLNLYIDTAALFKLTAPLFSVMYCFYSIQWFLLDFARSTYNRAHNAFRFFLYLDFFVKSIRNMFLIRSSSVRLSVFEVLLSVGQSYFPKCCMCPQGGTWPMNSTDDPPHYNLDKIIPMFRDFQGRKPTNIGGTHLCKNNMCSISIPTLRCKRLKFAARGYRKWRKISIHSKQYLKLVGQFLQKQPAPDTESESKFWRG